MLLELLEGRIPGLRQEISDFIKAHGDDVLCEVSVRQALGGMRGIRGLWCDTSRVPADQGLLVRGTSIGKLTEKLPEEIFWLLLTGDLPTPEQLTWLQGELRKRAALPEHVVKFIFDCPEDMHPMRMLTLAINAAGHDSAFNAAYGDGMGKTDLWKPHLEDGITLMAMLPEIAARVYWRHTGLESVPEIGEMGDWGGHYAKLLGIDDPDGKFQKLMRLYLTLHCDHEGGNASMFSNLVIASTLYDQFSSVAGGLSALAGPLHGRANQECLAWIKALMKKYDGVPSADQVKEHVQATLDAKQVVPGYGHAVLRVTDPRFTAFLEFGKGHCPDDDVFKTVSVVFDVVPGILDKIDKIQNPWPNVDASSGAVVSACGLTEVNYYTVLFSVSRALGMIAQNVLNRAVGAPIIRPKSLTLENMKAEVGES